MTLQHNVECEKLQDVVIILLGFRGPPSWRHVLTNVMTMQMETTAVVNLSWQLLGFFFWNHPEAFHKSSKIRSVCFYPKQLTISTLSQVIATLQVAVVVVVVAVEPCVHWTLISKLSQTVDVISKFSISSVAGETGEFIGHTSESWDSKYCMNNTRINWIVAKYRHILD